MTETSTVIEAEVISTELAPAQARSEAHGLANLHGTTNPKAMLAIATEQADALADVVESRKLYATIRNKKHVTVEGWTTLGAMVGVFPVLGSVTPQATPDGFTITRKGKEGDTEEPLRPGRTFGFVASVEARTMDGSVVGSAESECTRAEAMWKDRDDHALRSMAQTRATSKALRLPLGFIMQLAGFNPTPEEEMPTGGSKIPDVPDLRKLPEGYDPAVWGKQVLLVLTGGNVETAKSEWARLLKEQGIDPADPMDKGTVEGVVDVAHASLAQDPFSESFIDPGYGE